MEIQCFFPIINHIPPTRHQPIPKSQPSLTLGGSGGSDSSTSTTKRGDSNGTFKQQRESSNNPWYHRKLSWFNTMGLGSDGSWKWWAMEMMGLGNYHHPRNDGPLKRWHRNLQILNHLKVIYSWNCVPCTLFITLRSIQLELDQYIGPATTSYHLGELLGILLMVQKSGESPVIYKNLWKIYGCFQK